ncbi:MAG: BspA family leucine-rich repeat surface protein [Bacteroidota bacterium]
MKKSLILFILCLWQTALSAQCDVTDDILQPISTGFYSMSPTAPNNVGQTFTPTCGSTLEGVSFWTDAVLGGTIGGVSVTAELWKDPLVSSRTLITSQTLDLPFSSDNTEQYFVFADFPQINAGTEYGIRFVKNDADKTIQVLVDVDNVFPNGEMFRNFGTGGISGWDLRFGVHYEDKVPPVANCQNITVSLDQNNTASISANQIDNGSFDADTGIDFMSVSPSTFDCENIGNNTVTLFLRDKNQNLSNCQATVTILDGNAPVLTCPDNITVFTDPGVPIAVTYDAPTYEDCSFEAPSGFTFIAVRDNKSYFLSDSAIQASQAFANAESAGGFVATIIDAEHNNFIRNAVNVALGTTTEPVLIGYSDASAEGFFSWHAGNENAGYENWDDGEPNNQGDEDYTVIKPDGKWNDINRDSFMKYILQLASPTINRTTGFASGGVFPVGTTTNTFQATDGSGNTGTCSFTVTVEQNPYETDVSLTEGKLSISDIQTSSNDQISLSNDGTTLTISNLVSPVRVATGITLSNATTVTVPLTSVTAGIEFIAGNGTNAITFSDALTLTGSGNDIVINNISSYSQLGTITTGGDFTIAGNADADISLGGLTAANLSITGVNRIYDTNNQINVSGTTNLKTDENININGFSSNHQFGGAVSIEASSFYFTAGGDTTFGTITTTDSSVNINTIFILPGDLTLSGAVQTAGVSELFLRGYDLIEQTSSGAITTNVLTLQGRSNGTTVASLGAANNDVAKVETSSNNTFNTINFKDIDDVELGDFSANNFTIIAPTINLTSATNITKNGSGESSFLGNINASTGGTINHNAGTLFMTGTTADLSGLTYNGAAGTTTTTTANTVASNNLTFNTLNLGGSFDPNGHFVTILNKADISGSNGVLTGSGGFSGNTIINEDSSLTPGGTANATLQTKDLLLTSSTFIADVEGTTAGTLHDQVKVVGTVTISGADLQLSGGFSIQTGDKVVLIDNDGTDAVTGTFNGLTEGSGVTFGDFNGVISYTGGDGNDVTLLPDTVAPIAVCQDLTLTINPSGSVQVAGSQLDGGSTDNVGIGSFLIGGTTEATFTYSNLGENQVLVTVVDTSGNTASCNATVTVNSGVTLPIMISEYQPETSGSATNQTIEFSGTAGESLVANFIVIENDQDSGAIGLVRSTAQISGTFDSNGLLTATIPKIVAPSHTVALVSALGVQAGTTDIDDNNDGTADNSTALGVIFDAIGVVDESLDVGYTYGNELGGSDLPYISGSVALVFRAGSTGDLYAIDALDTVYDNTGAEVSPDIFNADPTSTTFGAVNPGLLGTDAYFITTWKTDNTGGSDNNQITIPTATGETYNYTVFWGDNTFDSGITGDITHTYTTAGTYTVSIIGTFPRIDFSEGSDDEKLLTITQWGSNAWTSMEDAFNGCANLNVVATDEPDLSGVTSLSNMFYECHALVGTSDFNDWDVSNVENFRSMFFDARLFNQPLANWQTTSATSMAGIFSSALAFNQPINNWNVSNVTNMSSMFNRAASFNQNLNSWNTAQVQYMDFMFLGAANFNGAIGNWNVSNVIDMSWMFNIAEDFNQDLNNWNVGQVQEMDFMFLGATSFNGDIADWNPTQVTTMYAMFQNAVNFNQDVSDWNVSNVTDMGFMFKGATRFNQPLDDWTVSSLTMATDMLVGTAFSNTNYDKLLLDWSELSLQNDVSFGVDASYCIGEAARNVLTDSSGLNWTISDGGIDCSEAFITSWKTNNPGGTDNNTIRIPAFGGTFNYIVDWGDGTLDSGVTGVISHTYTTSGTYDVSIVGDFPGIYFNNSLNISGSILPGADRLKIITIKQWGAISWASMQGAFFGCENLDVTATDVPDLSNVTRLTQMFSSCQALQGTTAFNSWNVSSITDMRSTFAGARLFNQPLNSWNVSNVTQMFGMFDGAESFNQPLSNWNVSNVEQMAFMFNGAKDFNQSLNNWVVTSVADMTALFDGAEDFNQPLNSWDVSGVSIMGSMFEGASSFNQPLNNWNVSGAQNMSEMFLGASNFNQDISGWNVSNVQTMLRMFQGATNFNQPLNDWNVSSVRSMWSMFSGASTFNQPLNNWDVSEVQQMKDMFANATAFDQDLGDWDLSSIQQGGTLGLNGMFANIELSIDNYDSTLLGWARLDTGETRIPSNITFDGGSSEYCAAAAEKQELIDTYGWTITDGGAGTCDTNFITTWQTTSANESITIPTASGETYDYTVFWGDGTSSAGVTGNATHQYATAGVYTVQITGDFPRIYFNNGGDKVKILSIEQWGDMAWSSMENAFWGCKNLNITNSAIDQPDLSSVTSMESIFTDCQLFNGDITNWDVSNVEDFEEAFSYCYVFNQDIGSWNMSSATSLAFMFYETENFNQDIGNWNVSNVTNMEGVFADTDAFNKDLNSWNVSNVIYMDEMFYGALVFNGNIALWNVSNVEKMDQMFAYAEAFDQDIGSWNVSNVNDMERMFEFAKVFNQDIGDWDVGNVTNMNKMFRGALYFDQDLGDWDIGSIVDTGFSSGMRDMFSSSPSQVQWLSIANYDSTLIGWNTDSSSVPNDGIDDIPENIVFDGGKAQYCDSETERQNLIDTHGWTIDDDGKQCPILVEAKVYLQGASLNPNTGEESLMRDDLRVGNLVPLTSPYSDGIAADASVLTITGANAIVDWVWVELRDETTSSFIVDNQSALLQRDGDIVSVDGVSPLRFTQNSDNYYIAVKHRNHLGIMSNVAIALSTTSTTVNFSDGSTTTYGSNAQTTFGMPTGLQGMWAGDANGDGKVNIIGATNDINKIRDTILNDPINQLIQFYGFVVMGYNDEDVNLTGGANFVGANNDANVLRDDVLNHPINTILGFYGYNIQEQLPAVVSMLRMDFDAEMTEKNKQHKNN